MAQISIEERIQRTYEYVINKLDLPEYIDPEDIRQEIAVFILEHPETDWRWYKLQSVGHIKNWLKREYNYHASHIQVDDIDDDISFADSYMISKDEEYEYNELRTRIVREIIDDCLFTLTSRESAVLRLHYGYDNHDPVPLYQVSKMLVDQKLQSQIRSVSLISIVHIKALDKCRHYTRAKYLKPLYGYYDETPIQFFIV